MRDESLHGAMEPAKLGNRFYMNSVMFQGRQVCSEWPMASTCRTDLGGRNTLIYRTSAVAAVVLSPHNVPWTRPENSGRLDKLSR